MYSPTLLQNRVALVTGGSGGIGKAIASAYAAHGARVVAADLRVPASSPAGDGDIRHIELDVTRADDVRAVFDDVARQYGSLDIVVNVAGIVSFGSAEKLPLEEWNRVLAINLTGTFLCCQAAIPHMRQQNFGRIINMGSVVGKNGGNARPWLAPAEQDRASNVAYGVSKAGVHMMTAFLAKELAASGVTVNSIAPGPVASEMTTSFPQALRDLIPTGRMGEADDIARAALFLAAPQNSFITGETLDVNGGIWCD